MKGIILHGGHGTRLRPLTHTGPKQLLPIANKPMSEYCVESLINAGIKEIAFIVGGIGLNKVREYYGDGEKFNAKFSYILQDSPKGIAHAVSLCEEFVDNEKFLVFLGDNIILRDIDDFIRNFEKSNAEASLLLCEVENPSQFGVAKIDNNKIISIIEKPKNPVSNLAVTGIYFLSPHIFEIIKKLKPSWRNELEISEALQLLIDEGSHIIFEVITDFWKDTGTPNDILDANRIILKNMIKKKENSEMIKNNIIIGKDSIIKSQVVINGPVIIGDNCVIENCTIDENCSIGNNCNINGAHISNSIIMEDCSLFGKINIRNSIIGSNSKINKEESNDKKRFLLGEGTQITL